MSATATSSVIALSDLEKQLKAVVRTGKYVVGRKEVLGSLKGSKLLVWSSSAAVPAEILNQCRSLQIPAIRFDGNPIELGRSCGIPFKVSVIAVKSSGEADLDSFAKSQDYVVGRYGPQLQAQAVEETVTPAPAPETKKKRRAKKEEGKVAEEEEEGAKGRKKKSASAAKKAPKKEEAKTKKQKAAGEEGEEKAAPKTKKASSRAKKKEEAADTSEKKTKATSSKRGKGKAKKKEEEEETDEASEDEDKEESES